MKEGRPANWGIPTLIAAWLAFVASMLCPGDYNVGITPLVAIGYVPVGVIAVGILLMPLMIPFSWVSPASLSILLFLLSPMLMACRRRYGVVVRLLALGLLGVWVLPLAMIKLIPPQDIVRQEIGHLAWGYYAMAGAQTLAFVAIEFLSSHSRASPHRDYPQKDEHESY